MLLHSSRFTFTQFGSSMMLGSRWKSLTHVLCTPNRRNSRKIHSAILLNSQFDEFFPSRSQNFIDFLSILAFAHEHGTAALGVRIQDQTARCTLVCVVRLMLSFLCGDDATRKWWNLANFAIVFMKFTATFFQLLLAVVLLGFIFARQITVAPDSTVSRVIFLWTCLDF